LGIRIWIQGDKNYKTNWKNVKNFMKVFGHQNLDLDSDPDSPKILDPDPKHEHFMD
jgi:hypothetical protein